MKTTTPMQNLLAEAEAHVFTIDEITAAARLALTAALSKLDGAQYATALSAATEAAEHLHALVLRRHSGKG